MGSHLHIDDNIHVKALNGLFDPKISKVYFERAIKVVRNIAGYQQYDHSPLPFVDVSCFSSCLRGLSLCVLSGCFSGQMLDCRAGHPFQSSRRRVLSCLYGWFLCVFSGCFSGQTLDCRAGHPLQSSRRCVLSCLYGRSLCVLFRSPFRPNA